MVAPNTSAIVTKRPTEAREDGSVEVVAPKQKNKLQRIVPSITLGTSVSSKPRIGDDYQAVIPPLCQATGRQRDDQSGR